MGQSQVHNKRPTHVNKNGGVKLEQKTSSFDTMLNYTLYKFKLLEFI